MSGNLREYLYQNDITIAPRIGTLSMIPLVGAISLWTGSFALPFFPIANADQYISTLRAVKDFSLLFIWER
jgi:hypothetical protein